MTTTVNARLLTAAYRFAGVNDKRTYLNGVRIETAPNGVGALLIATDGHRLAVLYDADGECSAPVIVPHTKRAAPRKNSLALMATFADDRVTWSDGLSAPAPLVEGHFPDWRMIIPPADGETPPGGFVVNPAYIGDLQAICAAYDTRYPAVQLTRTNSGRIACLFPCAAFAVVMEMRPNEAGIHARPAWLDRTPAPTDDLT
jgi:hypothetical protein